MAKWKKHPGNRPDPRTSHLVTEFAGWELYELKQPGPSISTMPENRWINLKLVAATPQPIKGNYWVSFHRDHRCFARSSDFATLEENQTALLYLLTKAMNAYCDAFPLPR